MYKITLHTELHKYGISVSGVYSKSKPPHTDTYPALPTTDDIIKLAMSEYMYNGIQCGCTKIAFTSTPHVEKDILSRAYIHETFRQLIMLSDGVVSSHDGRYTHLLNDVQIECPWEDNDALREWYYDTDAVYVMDGQIKLLPHKVGEDDDADGIIRLLQHFIHNTFIPVGSSKMTIVVDDVSKDELGVSYVDVSEGVECTRLEDGRLSYRFLELGAWIHVVTVDMKTETASVGVFIRIC